MGTTRLQVYNGALILCGQRPIATLDVNEEGRRLLDAAWNDNAALHCLEEGQWIFAMRGSQFQYDSAIEPTWGYRRGVGKPTDWVNTSAVCSDEYFEVPLTAYSDEGGIWYSDLDILYVKYVSSDGAYGMAMGRWPASFVEYVKAYLASKIIYNVSASPQRREELMQPNTGILAQARLTALNRDAMAKPTQFPARGTWTRSRHGRNTMDWQDGGNRNRLIG